MTDIVERLRAEGADAMRKHLSLGMHALCTEAAARIEADAATIAELRNMLRVFLGRDKRFVVSIGGNPLAIDDLIARARALAHPAPEERTE